MLKNLALLLVLVLAAACSQPAEDRGADDYSLEMVGQKSIRLDSMTGFFTYNIQQLNYEGKESIAILNHFINRIQIYDLSTGQAVEHIDYDLVGPNGVGEKPRSFYVQNRDSIFVFDSWSAKVSLLNKAGVIVDKYDLAANGLNDGYAVPQGSTQRPLLFWEGNLYLAGLLLPWQGVDINEKQFIKYDVKTREIEYLLKRPEIYNEYNWGKNVMYYLNYDFDPEERKFLFSFNNYDHLIVTDLNFQSRSEHATGSKHFNELTPFSNKISFDWKPDEIEEYNFQNPRYWAVIHDKYRDITYRFVLRPNSRQDFKAGVRNMKTSLLILDNEYNKIGEYEFDRAKYDSRMYFVTEDGIHFANKEKFAENEDEMVFDLFIPNKTS